MSQERKLSRFENRFPGFLNFYSKLLGYYFAACPNEHTEVAARMLTALESLGEEADKALFDFAEAGIFSGEPFSNRNQVELFWKSPLMAVFEAAIGYTPPADTDLSPVLPEPVNDVLELVHRRQATARRVLDGDLARGDFPYWRACLANCAPELYLTPFLAEAGPLVGLDVGCGWGRGSLSLPHLDRLQITGVDVSAEQLHIFRSLAQNLGWSGLKTSEGTEFPLPDDSVDFAVSMAFLDLLEEEQIRQTLRELLRILRVGSPVHIEAPTRSEEGITVVTQFSVEQLIDIFHTEESAGKVFQLIQHDPRIPDLFTFGVLDKDALPPGPRTGRKAQRHRLKARRLLLRRPEPTNARAGLARRRR